MEKLSDVRRSLVGVGQHARAVRVADDDLVDHVEEQAVLHHADRVDEVFGQLLRVIDALQVQVHHEVVLVGAHFLAIGVKTKHRLVAAVLELLDDVASAERNDLDRQRELADGVHNLGLVHNPHDLVGVGGHDLLPAEQRHRP